MIIDLKYFKIQESCIKCAIMLVFTALVFNFIQGNNENSIPHQLNKFMFNICKKINMKSHGRKIIDISV